MRNRRSITAVVAVLTGCIGSCSTAPVPLSKWTVSHSGVSNTLYGVDMGADGVAIAVGANGTILHSDDSGVSWTSETSPVTGDIASVCFVSNGNVVAVSTTGEILLRRSGTWQVVAYSPE